MTSEEIRQFCHRYIHAWGRSDIQALLSCYTADCEVTSPIFKVLHGHAQLESSFRDIFRAFEKIQITIDDIVVDRDRRERAVVLFTGQGTHRGEIFGMSGTGRRFELHGAFVLTFVNDRIAHEARMYDFTSMLMQLGVLRAKTA